MVPLDIQGKSRGEYGEGDRHNHHSPRGLALVDDAEDYRLVLTDGEFTDARGLGVEERGTVAILLEQSDEEIEAIEEVDEYGRTVVYSLTWTIPHEE